MTTEDRPKFDLGINRRDKNVPQEVAEQLDEVGRANGFVERDPSTEVQSLSRMKRQPGRRKGPVREQIHPRIKVESANEFFSELERLNDADDSPVSQGQLFERMWAAYKQKSM